MDKKQLVLEGIQELWVEGCSPMLLIAEYVGKWEEMTMTEDSLAAFEELTTKEELEVIEEFIKWVGGEANGQQY